jgi:phytoene dehydrogenase-like protein
MLTLGCLHKRTAGYPIGGSLAFSQAIARRYEQLGGVIQYKAKVRQILVQGDRAVGVRLDDGSEHTPM